MRRLGPVTAELWNVDLVVISRQCAIFGSVVPGSSGMQILPLFHVSALLWAFHAELWNIDLGAISCKCAILGLLW